MNALSLTLLFAPVPVYLLLHLLLRSKGRRTAGLSADVTTFLLFAAVPLTVQFFWGQQIFAPLATAAVLAAIVLLIREWRKVKDFEVGRFLRKLWRIFFLVLSASYAATWLAGLTWLVVEAIR